MAIPLDPRVASDISSWIGVDRRKTLNSAKASRRFDSKLKVLVFEANGQGKSRYCVMTDDDVFKSYVNEEVKTADDDTESGATDRIIFLDFVSDSAPVEKRQLQITDKLFEFVCKELQIPAYFVDTVLRDDQLGRLGFGSYLHPELSYRYAPRLRDGTLDLNANLHYIYTRYNIRGHSSLTLCVNPHIETRNLWMGLKRGEAGLAGCPTNEWQDSNPERFSVGRNRAGRGSGSPLAFHILITQMTLEDWRNGLKVGRQRLIRAERESGMAVNKSERLLSSGDSRTELPSKRSSEDIEHGIPMQNLYVGESNKSDAVQDILDLEKTEQEEVSKPKSRKERLRGLHDTIQRLTVAENSCKEIENRVVLLLQSVETLRSIPKRTIQWLEYANPGTTSSSSSAENGVPPSTLDREQQILESIQLSCRHSQQWTQCYKERTNIQIQLDFNRLTSDIAWEAQRDTSAMNNINILTTLFLPGTFVCAVFSIIFPDTDDTSHPRPVPRAYIYAFITIPLTVLVAFSLWFVNGISHAWRLRDFDRLRYDQAGDGGGQQPLTLRSWLRSGLLHTPW